MERLILKRLLEWKNSPYRKPLILKGVRQVGSLRKGCLRSADAGKARLKIRNDGRLPFGRRIKMDTYITTTLIYSPQLMIQLKVFGELAQVVAIQNNY